MSENTKTKRNSTWAAGGILILIGALYLVRNLTGFDLGDWNWWALFILIPAFAFLTRAWRTYQAEGRLTGATRSPLVTGLVLLLITAIFLLDLSWGTMWPLFLIIAGVGALLAQIDEMPHEPGEEKHKNEDEQEVVVQVQNDNGSITPVVLKRKNGDYVGPNGEHYKRLPTAEQRRRVKAKLLVLQGANDPYVDSGQISNYVEAMNKTDIDWQMILYGGAMHGFSDPNAAQYNAKEFGYNETADRRSWKQVELFLLELFAK